MEAFCQIPLESTGDCDCHIKRQRFLPPTSHIVGLTILLLSCRGGRGTPVRVEPPVPRLRPIPFQKCQKFFCGLLDLVLGSPLSIIPLCLKISSSLFLCCSLCWPFTDFISLVTSWRGNGMEWQRSGFKRQHSPLQRNNQQKARSRKTLKIKGLYFLGKPHRCSAMTNDMTVILTPYSPMLKLFMRTKHHMRNRLPDAK